MIRHIVFIKVPNRDEAIKAEVQKRLLGMKGKIDVLKNIEVGLNFSQEERAFDVALITDFDTKEGLNAYATDPVHVEVLTYLKSLPVETKVIDFEF